MKKLMMKKIEIIFIRVYFFNSSKLFKTCNKFLKTVDIIIERKMKNNEIIYIDI